MRKIIRKYKKIYMAQKGQHKKRLVVENAYNEIVSGGARFVKQSEDKKNEWVEVMMHEALEKVAHTIRYKPRNAKEGTSGKAGNDEDESSADEEPLNMAANTVVLSRDQPAFSLSAQVQARHSVEPASGPTSYSSQMAAANHTLNSLLNPGIAHRQVNQIVPPISLLDVYVNPINRPFLQAGLMSPNSYAQRLLLSGFGANRYDLNQAPIDPNLTAAMSMNSANAAGHQAILQHMQHAVRYNDKKPQPQDKPVSKALAETEQEQVEKK
ncbi:MAG: hypothetical protein SGBAC_007060 [Bacillariaceae sp.]